MNIEQGLTRLAKYLRAILLEMRAMNASVRELRAILDPAAPAATLPNAAAELDQGAAELDE
jgi:hypothetical protein